MTGIAQDDILYILDQVAGIYLHELASVKADGVNSYLRALPTRPFKYIPARVLAFQHPIQLALDIVMNRLEGTFFREFLSLLACVVSTSFAEKTIVFTIIQ